MKRLLGVILAFVIVAMAATPAAAQGPDRSDHACFGGNTLVTSRESPLNVILFGCGARIQSETQIRQDIVSFGGDVVIESGARIAHDVVVFGGHLTIESGAVVGHDVVTFGNQADIKEGAVIGGRASYGAPGFSGFRGFSPFWYTGVSFWSDLVRGFIQGLIMAIALAALGALVLVFLPAQTQQVAVTTEHAALPSLGVGCLTWLVALGLTVLLAVTCIGIPLIAVVGIAVVAAALFGWIAVSIVLGNRLTHALSPQPALPIVAMLVGVLILWIMGQIPVLGCLINIFVATLAIGAVVLTRFGTRPYPMPVTPFGPVPTALPPLAPPPPPPPPPPPVPPAPPAPPVPPNVPVDPSI